MVYEKVIIINGEGLGNGDEGVGKTLVGVFLRKLIVSLQKPDVIIFYNSAAKLAVKGSAILDVLEALELVGIELLVCGTCVYKACGQYSLIVGRITNMDEITDIILNAKQVITL